MCERERVCVCGAVRAWQAQIYCRPIPPVDQREHGRKTRTKPTKQYGQNDCDGINGKTREEKTNQHTTLDGCYTRVSVVWVCDVMNLHVPMSYDCAAAIGIFYRTFHYVPCPLPAYERSRVFAGEKKKTKNKKTLFLRGARRCCRCCCFHTNSALFISSISHFSPFGARLACLCSRCECDSRKWPQCAL